MSEPTDPNAAHRTAAYNISQWSERGQVSREDQVVVEEPMEIRLLFGSSDKRALRSLSVTMRTPGNDDELAAGFLFTEVILQSPQQIEQIESRGVDDQGRPTGNTVRVALRPDVEMDFARLQRHFFATSSCGVCGKASLDTLEVKGLRALSQTWRISADAVRQLPAMLCARSPHLL